MIKAIGVDLVKVSRISRILQSSRKDRFLSRVLHSSELATYLTIEASKKASEFVAGSWAAKEAVYKTLEKDDQLQFSFNEWYRYKVDDKPQISKDPPLKNNSFLLSVSHDGDHLIATALRLETK